jgi:hypothetical protein
MQEIIQNCINALKNNNGIILSYPNATFIVCDIRNSNIIKSTDSNFKAIIVREDVYIEDYCGGVTPTVYDLIDFSNKNIFLQLPKLKNASEYLIIDGKFGMYHVPKEEFLLMLCNKYKKGLAIIESEKEDNNQFYHVNLPTPNHPFKPRAIIQLLENGEIKVIEK